MPSIAGCILIRHSVGETMVISRTCVLLACMAAAVPSGTLIAQATTGTIYGNVADSSGLAVTGANVKVINVATNVARTTTSGADGSFTLPFVPIGTYRVEIDSPGFKKFEQSGLVLDIDRNARINAILEIGQLTETVLVTSDAPLVETKAPALGVTIQNKEIDDLPLVDRDLYSL